jgi:hypothetical protein
MERQHARGLQYCARGISVDDKKPLTGLAVLTLGGFCFGLLTPLFFIATSALATTEGWRILPDGWVHPHHSQQLRRTASCKPHPAAMRGPSCSHRALPGF